jgi:hypothetical protein
MGSVQQGRGLDEAPVRTLDAWRSDKSIETGRAGGRPAVRPKTALEIPENNNACQGWPWPDILLLVY